MTPEEQFKQSVREAAKKFREIPKSETIKLVSHLDCDGLSSCSLMIKTMILEKRKYTVSILQQLDAEKLEELAKDSSKYFIITDLGSGIISLVNKLLSDKQIFILDHHIPEKTENYPNIIHVNPLIFGVDGNTEISASGVAFLFASAVNPEMEKFAHIGIIGACGDMQENNGFKGINAEILDIAIKNDLVVVSKGLRFFGRQTRPLHKILEYSSNPFIPGVTGSESGAIQFLQSIGINPKNSLDWKKIIHLTDQEMKSLITGIVMRRLSQSELTPEDVFGNIYTLKNEKPESPLREIKEFATLLNACGRLKRPSLGIGACIGDEKMKQSAIDLGEEYKRTIVSAMRWYEENKNSENITLGENFIIINAKDFILSTIIGTMASMIGKSSSIKEGTYILALAYQNEKLAKVSFRLSGNNSTNINLRAILEEMTGEMENCEFGGHENAAGAIIPIEKETEFIEKAKFVLGKRAIEEQI